jgi:hypothetical protein
MDSLWLQVQVIPLSLDKVDWLGAVKHLALIIILAKRMVEVPVEEVAAVGVIHHEQ